MSIELYRRISKKYATYVTVEVAAEACGVSKPAIHGYKRRRRVRSIKLGKRLRVRLDDVLFLAKKKEILMPVGSTQSDYYTVREIARKLSVSDNTIYTAIANRYIPYVNFGAKAYRIPARKFDRMLDTMEQEGLSLSEYHFKYGAKHE